jgi:hypothetical protein
MGFRASLVNLLLRAGDASLVLYGVSIIPGWRSR